MHRLSLSSRDAFAGAFDDPGRIAMLTEPTTYLRFVGPVSSYPKPLVLPVGSARVALGFPSPAEDFLDDGIDLNDALIRNPAATFLYRAEGSSMILAGICDGDILVIDRSVTPLEGDIVMATWEGNQPTCKVLKVANDHIELHSRNPHCPNVVLLPETEVEVFSVVGVVRQIRRSSGRVRAG